MKRRKREPIRMSQVQIRCRHCLKLFRQPVAQDHIARCLEQQRQEKERLPWWVTSQ